MAQKSKRWERRGSPSRRTEASDMESCGALSGVPGTCSAPSERNKLGFVKPLGLGGLFMSVV